MTERTQLMTARLMELVHAVRRARLDLDRHFREWENAGNISTSQNDWYGQRHFELTKELEDRGRALAAFAERTDV